VIVLNGRFAGRKAVVLRTYETGTKERKFGHALVAGIERAPRKITKVMEAEDKAKRMRIKPFVKFINFQHMMPTRYNLDISEELSKLVKDDSLVEASSKKALKTSFKAKLEERYRNLGQVKNEKYTTGVQYFFRCVPRAGGARCSNQSRGAPNPVSTAPASHPPRPPPPPRPSLTSAGSCASRRPVRVGPPRDGPTRGRGSLRSTLERLVYAPELQQS